MKKIKIYVFFLFILINFKAHANDSEFNEYFLNSTNHSLKLGSSEYKFEILKRKVIKMILISFIKIF